MSIFVRLLWQPDFLRNKPSRMLTAPCSFLSWPPQAPGRVQTGNRHLWKRMASLLSEWSQKSLHTYKFQTPVRMERRGLDFPHVPLLESQTWEMTVILLTCRFVWVASLSFIADLILVWTPLGDSSQIWEELKGACHYKKVHTRRYILSVGVLPLWFG